MAKGKGYGGPSSLMGSAPGTATQRQVGRKSDESNLIYAIIPGIRKKIASRLKSRLWACSFIPPILSLGTSNQVSRRGAEATVSAAAPLSAPVPLCRIYALRALAPFALRWTLRSTFKPVRGAKRVSAGSPELSGTSKASSLPIAVSSDEAGFANRCKQSQTDTRFINHFGAMRSTVSRPNE
jgi:hypothetical protein